MPAETERPPEHRAGSLRINPAHAGKVALGAAIGSMRVQGPVRRRDVAHRGQPLWTAALIHRISGVLLALFLPLHFLALGLALEGEARLQGFLRWSEQPLVKLAEGGLIALLVVHLLGGIRVLVIENLPWHSSYKSLALGAFACGLIAGLVFLLRWGLG